MARGAGSDVAVTITATRFLVGGEDLRQALFDYLACDRVAAAWARKRPAKDKDLERKQEAEGRY